MRRIHWGYLIAGVVLAAIVFVSSLLVFPASGQSVGVVLALAVLVAAGVVEFLANWRQAFERAAPPAAGALVGDVQTGGVRVESQVSGDVVGGDKSTDQVATGSYIAQATRGGTATVTVTHIEPAPPVFPPLHQLRAPVADLPGRAEEMAKLVSALQPGQAAAVCSIGGMGEM